MISFFGLGIFIIFFSFVAFFSCCVPVVFFFVFRVCVYVFCCVLVCLCLEFRVLSCFVFCVLLFCVVFNFFMLRFSVLVFFCCLFLLTPSESLSCFSCRGLSSPFRFFVEALLGLAEQLGALSPQSRAKGLQDGLERINEFFLSERAQGSDVIYVPFGGGFHQVRHYYDQKRPGTNRLQIVLHCFELFSILIRLSDHLHPAPAPASPGLLSYPSFCDPHPPCVRCCCVFLL